MKLTVSRSLLSDALRKVQSLAGGKNALPILSNVKIEAADQKAQFTTTDLDLSVVLEIACNVTDPGATTLPAKLLCDAISRAAEGDVSLEVDDATCKSTIRAGSSVFKITGRPAVEFPVLPGTEEDANEFTIPQDTLKGLFRRTAFAMSEDETRRSLRGVHVKFAEGFLTCVATDGRRMAIAEYHPETAFAFDLEFTLPAKSVNEMMRHLGSTGNVSFVMCKSQIVASFDSGIVFYSKLVDDTYPNYMQVIPKENTNVVTIDRASLMSAIDRVGIFSDSFSMKFIFADNTLNLSSSTETGKGEESVPVKYDGQHIESTFNHEYILDVLRSIDDDEVKMAFADGTNPVLITSSAPGLALVMPLRIN